MGRPMNKRVIAALAAFIAIGRLTVTGHGLTGWPGLYEALAHIAVGVLIGAAVYEFPVRRRAIVAIIVALSLFEILMFKAQGV